MSKRQAKDIKIPIRPKVCGGSARCWLKKATATAREQLQGAVAIFTRAFGEQHLITQQCQRQLAALDTPPPSTSQQIADITAHFEAAVAAALAEPISDRTALLQQLEERAHWAETGEAAGSPFLALAAHLRALAGQLKS
jgi:hypothetical protein